MPAKGDGVEREREEVVVVDGVGAKFGGEGGGLETWSLVALCLYIIPHFLKDFLESPLSEKRACLPIHNEARNDSNKRFLANKKKNTRIRW